MYVCMHACENGDNGASASTRSVPCQNRCACAYTCVGHVACIHVPASAFECISTHSLMDGWMHACIFAHRTGLRFFFSCFPCNLSFSEYRLEMSRHMHLHKVGTHGYTQSKCPTAGDSLLMPTLTSASSSSAVFRIADRLFPCMGIKLLLCNCIYSPQQELA